MSGLTKTQVERLTRGIDPSHVEVKRGGLSYIAQHQVRAELSRVFGYGNWDAETIEMTRLWEETYEKDRKTYYRVCYRAAVRLTIRDYEGKVICSHVGYHAEANSGLPDRGEAEAMAVTSCESYALRRAAINLGDRFGLGLYDGGKQVPLVKGTLQTADQESPLYEAPATQATATSPDRSDRMARMQAAVNGGDK